MSALRDVRVVVVLLAAMRCSGAVSVGDIPIIGPQIKGTHLEVRPITVGRCTHVEQAIVETAVTYRMSGRTRVAMDVDVIINRSVKQYTQMHIAVTKCKDVVSEKSCDPVNTTVQKGGICPAIHAPLMPWSDLISKIRPVPRCPIDQGNYTAHNFFIDTTGADTLLSRETKSRQLEGYIWLARMTIFEQDMVHLCFESIFEFVRVRNTAGWHGEKRGYASTSTAQPHPESNAAKSAH